jgi:dipeptidase E
MKQIVAMGGGGFSMEPGNPLLDEYLLKQTGKSRPSVCFLGTASGDSPDYISRFYAAFAKLNCKPSHLSLFRDLPDIESFLLSQDAIYVGGGNTKSLLALWREWGVDRVLRKAWTRGIVLGGLSAGSICWFDQGLTDSLTGRLRPLPCLGFLRGSNCPHYDGEAERRPAYTRFIRAGKMLPGLAADDGVAFHFVGSKLRHIVSSRPNARAYRVFGNGTKFREELLLPRYLGRKV